MSRLSSLESRAACAAMTSRALSSRHSRWRPAPAAIGRVVEHERGIPVHHGRLIITPLSHIQNVATAKREDQRVAAIGIPVGKRAIDGRLEGAIISASGVVAHQ